MSSAERAVGPARPGTAGGRPGHRSPHPDHGQRTALVTGCSSGIGRASALALHEAGLRVWASARRPETLAELSALGLDTVALDVTDESSMTSAVQRIEAACGAVDVLVNNAGYGLSGTVEETPAPAIRDQFETNVFGPARLIQLVLPGMRRQSSGTIITVSSIFGRYGVPGAGYYHATKHANEALSDALRHEVAPFGIKVVVVQPGPVRTRFADRYVGGMVAGTNGSGAGPYGEFRSRAAEYYDAVYSGSRRTLAGTFASTSEDVAARITRAATSRAPRARYPVGLIAHSTLALHRLLPDRLFDALVVRRRFPVPRPSAQQRSLDVLMKGSYR